MPTKDQQDRKSHEERAVERARAAERRAWEKVEAAANTWASAKEDLFLAELNAARTRSQS